MTTARFEWPMLQMIEDPNNAGKYILPTNPQNTRSLNQGEYRLRLIIKDTNGVPNYYPNRYDNPNYKPEDNPKQWMQISYVAADIPVIMIVEPMKQYYNGVGKYEVDLVINSMNPVTDVYAWITDTAEGTPGYESPMYDIDWVSSDGNRYIYKLTIDSAKASAWGARPNKDKPQLYLHFEAKDERDNLSPTLFRSFIFDVTPPQVMFERPVANLPVLAGSSDTMTGGKFEIQYPTNPPRWITGTATVSGSSLDASTGVSKVYYHIGKLGDDNLTNTERAELYEDNIWTDTNLDDFNPANHAAGWSGTVYAWQYTAPFSGDGGYNKTNHGHLVQEMSELNGVSDTAFDTSGRTRFYLPFYVKVVDGAGNFQIIHYKLSIDPDLDIPYATITSPSPTLEIPVPIIGGEVRLAGTASDNNWIHSVIVRMKKEGSSSWYIPATNPPTTEVYGIGSTFPMYEDDPAYGQPGYEDARAGWFRATKIGNDMVVGWYVNINGDGGLDPDGSDEFVNVSIEVRAVDTKTHTTTNTPSVVGPSTVLPVIFSTGAPRITNPKIEVTGVDPRDYYEGINSSGIFKITSVISDEKGIVNVRVKLNGVDYQLVNNSNAVTNVNAAAAGISITQPLPNPLHDNRIESNLEILVDTKTNTFYTANFGYGRSGYLDLDVNVQNNNQTPMFARGIYRVGIDNFYPTTTIETQFNASSVRRDELEGIAGRKFELSGIAKDYGDTSGSIQELSKVMIFFQEGEVSYASGKSEIIPKAGGAFMNQRGIKVGEQDNFYSGTWNTIPPLIAYPNVRYEGQTNAGSGAWGSSINWFPLLEQRLNSDPNIGWVWQSPHAMVIDNSESDPWLDLDGDGTYGEVWSGLVDKTWRAYMDTEYFDDGPLVVHYIVMDQAGNATRYQRGIYIENNKPQIVNVNFGTNIRGGASPTIWTSTSNPGDFMRDHEPIEITTAGNKIISFDPQFRIRGNQLALRLETRYGNNAMNYMVSHVEALPRISAANMVRGNVYTIETPGTTDWQKYGAINNSRQTTFVASGPGDGTGFVVEYNEIKTVSGGFNDPGNNPRQENGKTIIDNLLVFKSSDFGATSVFIQDSPKTAGEISRRPVYQRPNWPLDWEINWPERLFIVRIYDTTVSGAGIKIEDQLSHAILVALDVDNTDTIAPRITVAPFGQKYLDLENEALKTSTVAVSNYNENIVMSGTGTDQKREGYVQYSVHKTPNTSPPDISGQVVFLGKASDNQRIQNIIVTIPGFNSGSPITVAEWNPAPGTGLPRLESKRTAMGTASNEKWYFKITSDYLTLNFGHVVNWEFAWDSSEIDRTLAGVNTKQVGPANVTFSVNDYRPTPTVVQHLMSVNIVPYISEIETGLSKAYKAQPSAFARSSTGRYPVRENEEITIRGFNLGLNEAVVNNAITGLTIGSTSLTYNSATTVASGNFRVVSKNEILANIGTSAASGNLTVLVGAVLANASSRVSSINNNTVKFINPALGDTTGGANRVHYNWEPNNTNNNVLTNDRKLYVWNMGYLLNENSLVTSPFFRMDPKNAARYMSFGYYGTQGDMRVQINNGTGGNNSTNWTDTTTRGRSLRTNNNRFLNTTLAIGGSSDWYVAASNQTQGNQPFTLYTLTSAGAVVTRDLVWSATGGTGADPNKIKIPRIFIQQTSSNIPRVLMSYFDSYEDNVVLRYGGRQDFTTNTTSTFNGGITTTGAGTGSSAIAAGGQTVSTNTYRGSMYTAVGALSNGRPVIAFYDRINNNLVFAWNSVAPTATTYGTSIYPASYSWTYNIISNVDGTSGAKNGLGAHVDLAVDSGDNVHLAFYDTLNGGLYYARIPATGANTSTAIPNMTGVNPVRVDTFLAVGTKLMLNLRTDNIGGTSRIVPYISYFHGSFSETKNSIRVAWQKTFPAANGTDSQDMFTGAWEVMTVPALNTPLATEMICNGVPYGDAAWQNVGTTGGALAKRAATDIKKSILLAYFTDAYYEGAILNADLTANE